jgi:nucleoside 2-deoxyribosyltransferase
MKSVVICGSKRFRPEIRKFAKDLEKLGVVVYAPFLHEGKGEWESLSEDYKKFVALGLTHEHFYKIRMADVVYVYNKGGYSGNSTTLEVGYSVALNKPIYAYSGKDEEICRQVLVKEFLKTPKQLVKRLKLFFCLE